MDKQFDHHLTKIVPTISNTISHRDLRSVDFRPYQRQEGQAMTGSSEDDDGAIAVAFKRAAEKEADKRTKKRERREAKLATRLANIRLKRPESGKAAKAPVVQPAPATGAALQVSAQHYLQDTRAKEDRSRRLAQIALGRAPLKPAAERLPPSPPSGPDDPRILNGTMAPSNRVAEILREKEAAPPPTAPRERPLQTSPFPDGWLQILETGTPGAILAGRKLHTLKGDERQAYYRALARLNRDALTAPRRRKEQAGKSALHKVITELRFIDGQTLVQLAAKAGINKDTLNHLMRVGRSTDDRLELIAQAFGITLDDIKNMIDEQITKDAEEAARTAAEPEPAQKRKTRANKEDRRGMPDLSPEERSAHFRRLAKRANAKRAENRAAKGRTKPVPAKTPGNDHPRQGDAALDRLTAPRATDNHFQAALRAVMRERQLPGLGVARLCGLGLDVPSGLLRGNRTASKSTIAKLCAGLGLSEEQLTGTPSQPALQALQATVAAAVSVGIHAGREIMATPTDAEVEAELLAPAPVKVFPSVKVEMGIPMPPLILRAEMYPWDTLPKGGSFLAEIPFGLPWGTFRHRFQVMADRQSEKRGHWYTTEENEAKGEIRLWRFI